MTNIIDIRDRLRSDDDTVEIYEIVLEVPEADAERALAWMREVMTTPPQWAEGLPLAVDAKVMTRYGK